MTSPDSRAVRRRKKSPLRPLVHGITTVALMEKEDHVVVLLRDGRQYYRTIIPREALGRLANVGIVDLDPEDDSDGDEED